QSPRGGLAHLASIVAPRAAGRHQRPPGPHDVYGPKMFPPDERGVTIGRIRLARVASRDMQGANGARGGCVARTPHRRPKWTTGPRLFLARNGGGPRRDARALIGPRVWGARRD